MNLIQKYKQYKFRKILEEENPLPADIIKYYTKMPKSIYSYLKNKDTILSLFMMEDKLKEIITVDELQEYIENQQNKNFKALFEVQRTALLYFLHSYINEIEEDSLFHNILIIIGRALFVLNHISTGTTLIARQLELFKLMNQIQPQNDIFCETRLAPDVSQFNNINLMDMLGLIIRHHNDFKSCPFEIINTEIQHFASKEDFESFKQSHDMYTISHEQLKELIDKGWRFSIPELYQYFNAIFSQEFMQNVLLAQSLAGDNNTQFVSLLEMNETNKNKDISFSQMVFE